MRMLRQMCSYTRKDIIRNKIISIKDRLVLEDKMNNIQLEESKIVKSKPIDASVRQVKIMKKKSL